MFDLLETYALLGLLLFLADLTGFCQGFFAGRRLPERGEGWLTEL